MQFDINGRPDAATLAAALRPLDPAARIALDADSGRLDIATHAGTAEVADALRRAGIAVTPVVQELQDRGMLQAPAVLPEFLQRPIAQTLLARLRAGDSFLDLLKDTPP